MALSMTIQTIIVKNGFDLNSRKIQLILATAEFLVYMVAATACTSIGIMPGGFPFAVVAVSSAMAVNSHLRKAYYAGEQPPASASTSRADLEEAVI